MEAGTLIQEWDLKFEIPGQDLGLNLWTRDSGLKYGGKVSMFFAEISNF